LNRSNFFEIETGIKITIDPPRGVVAGFLLQKMKKVFQRLPAETTQFGKQLAWTPQEKFEISSNGTIDISDLCRPL
jgi:hypothetical protein